EPRHVAGEEVDVLQHATHDVRWQEVQRAGDGVRVRERRLVTRGAATNADLVQARRGIRGRDRNGEPLQRDAVAGHGVVLRADADRQRDAQLVRRTAVALVVAAEPTGDRGEERVVQRAARSGGGALEVVQID